MVIIWIVLALAVLAIGVVSIFVRRHGERTRPDPAWTPTDEVFNDPSTDRLMRVWVDESGNRYYVPERDLPERDL